MCSHREDAYRDLPLRHPLPHSERAQDQCILLPLFPDMTGEEQRRVASALGEACGVGAASWGRNEERKGADMHAGVHPVLLNNPK